MKIKDKWRGTDVTSHHHGLSSRPHEFLSPLIKQTPIFISFFYFRNPKKQKKNKPFVPGVVCLSSSLLKKKKKKRKRKNKRKKIQLSLPFFLPRPNERKTKLNLCPYPCPCPCPCLGVLSCLIIIIIIFELNQ